MKFDITVIFDTYSVLVHDGNNVDIRIVGNRLKDTK